MFFTRRGPPSRGIYASSRAGRGFACTCSGLAGFASDRSFARDAESLTEYFDAACALARNGFDLVIFGHTHLAREMALPNGARYLNSGTWADLIPSRSKF